MMALRLLVVCRHYRADPCLACSIASARAQVLGACVLGACVLGACAGRAVMRTRLRDLGNGVGRGADGLPDGVGRRGLGLVFSQTRSNGWPSGECSSAIRALIVA
jgi:hypothetical protein